MDWTGAVDGYCERIDPSFWAEPVNALTNMAFLLSALVMGWRLRGAGLWRGWAMVGVLALIGLGSGLFHTYARVWAGVADVVPILLFILIYIEAANRRYWGMAPWAALAAMLLFFPYVAGVSVVLRAVPTLAASGPYWAVALLIAGYGLALRRRHPPVARGLGIGAAILCVSLVARTLDMPLCDVLPMGTHFAWHLLNAVMLGWMIEVYRRHMLAGARAEG